MPADAEVRITGIEASATPVLPGQTTRVTVDVEVDCGDAATSQDATLRVTLDAPETTLAVAGAGTHALEVSACTPADLVLDAALEFQVTVLHGAPAMAPISIGVNAEVAQPPNLPPSGDASSFPITPDVVFQIAAQPEQKLQVVDGEGGARFQVELSNFGNSPIKVRIEAIDGPATLAAIDPVLLGASGNASSVATVTLVVDPGDRSEAAITVQLTPVYQFNESKVGNPITVSLLARREGSPLRDAPAPGPLLAIAVLAIALLAARRRA